MTLRHYEIFRCVAETGNFRRAAESLYITQSAVSHSVKELEERTGTRLFERLPKGVRITRSGELLLEEVRPILAASSSLESRLDCLEQKTPVYIVSSITIAIYHLPVLIKRLQNEIPDIKVQVEVVSAAAALEQLRIGKADIALIEGREPQGAFRSLEFAKYALEVVCAPGYPLPGTRLDIEEFCSEKLLLREEGSAIRDTLDGALLLEGRKAKPVWCSVNSSALLAAAREGLGITVLPDALVEEAVRLGDLIPLNVRGLKLTNKMLAVWHRDKYFNESLKKFVDLLKV